MSSEHATTSAPVDAIVSRLRETGDNEAADLIEQQRRDFGRMFGVAKTYCTAPAQLRGECYRDLNGTVEFYEGWSDAFGWPACFRRVENGLKYVITTLRSHHSTRPGITTICEQAERCLRGFNIDD